MDGHHFFKNCICVGGERPARISGSGRSACTTRAGSGAPSASRVLPVVAEPKALAVTRLCPPDALADMKYSIYIFLLKKKKKYNFEVLGTDACNTRRLGAEVPGRSFGLCWHIILRVSEHQWGGRGLSSPRAYLELKVPGHS